MHSLAKSLAFSVSLGALCVSAQSATISGSVKGPDGAAFKGAFISAQNTKTKITLNVLSQPDGRYSIKNLPAGEYDVQVKSVGFTNNEAGKLTLAGDGSASKDFALGKGQVQWSDINYWQGRQLFPDAPGKAPLFNACHACHGTQSRMVGKGHDPEGWGAMVDYMMGSMHYFLSERLQPQEVADVKTYLNQLFGKNSVLPKSPEDHPKYKETVRNPFTDESLKIVYVTYEMPNRSSFPWTATEDKDGKYWIPFYGANNKIARMDAETGAVEEFKTPSTNTASIHSAQPAPDGSVWGTVLGYPGAAVRLVPGATPPETTMSDMRSVMKMKPSSSTCPMSPRVKTPGRTYALAVFSGS